jgi:hypothetical protein
MSRLAWVVIFLFVLACIAWMTGISHHDKLLVEMGSHELFAQAGFEP